MHFTFSDLIAGYVTTAAEDGGSFGLRTTDGREFQVKLTDATYTEMVRNLSEPWQDTGAPLASMLTPDRYMFAYGVFYPEAGAHTFEAKHLVFLGHGPQEFRFEAQDWWITQIRALAAFYFTAQFPDGVIDYHNYRTSLTLEGQKIPGTRQETDTMSRMIYGFATAYMLLGEDRYLQAAEKGTEYLRDRLRSIDEEEQVVYWYHATDVHGGHERKVLASEFGDDYDAIPAYEQIYALAGPVQTFRITGDPRILRDAEMTINLFDRYFLDREQGGYFSHIDPITMDPRAESLTHNRARKNWNSVGDHAPAYLINLYLATGDSRWADMLASTADTIEAHFPDYENSPFVNEKFLEDWTHDHASPLQKNRAIVGHNLKIAWNLMRIHNMRPNPRYEALARKIAETMPKVGMDTQRGGWYDMVERDRSEGEDFHRLIWHDRKAWWQQEQGILAYLIMSGTLHEPEYLRLARESAAVYNAWFPDHDSGGVYFNILASGIPYLLGNERLKGSHSMSGYHSFELCYLASVYTNLLQTKQPMDFYFKPQPGALKDNILRVQPDLLPPGSVRLEAVWLNGEHYNDFDAEAMTVKLPDVAAGGASFEVKVRIVPAGMTFDMQLGIQGGVATLVLEGTFDDNAMQAFKAELDKVVAVQPTRLVLHMEDMHSISKECARVLAFARTKMAIDTDIFVVGANEQVTAVLERLEFMEEVTAVDTYDAELIGNS